MYTSNNILFLVNIMLPFIIITCISLLLMIPVLLYGNKSPRMFAFCSAMSAMHIIAILLSYTLLCDLMLSGCDIPTISIRSYYLCLIICILFRIRQVNNIINSGTAISRKYYSSTLLYMLVLFSTFLYVSMRSDYYTSMYSY